MKHVVCRRGREGASGSKHPDASLLGERRSLSHRPKNDLLIGGFQVQLVAWLQVQFLAQSLRNYDTVVVVAGPNGAGKSTFVETFLKSTGILVVNPDDVARGLSPATVAYWR